jgi:hypothetical protein
MSTIDVDLYGPPQEEDDERHPEFQKVLLGFDPRHVEEFVSQAGERIEYLERQLRDVRAHLEAANRRSAAAREEAYGEVAGRMAELLRAADQQAERIRVETEEAGRRQVYEAGQQAEQIRREAETHAEMLRAQAETELATARAEARRVLGDLSRHRDAVIGELQALREHLIGLVGRVEDAVEEPAPGTEGAAISLIAPMAPGIDDLLGTAEGFDLAPPSPWDDSQDDPNIEPQVAPEPLQVNTEILDLSWDDSDAAEPPPAAE